MQFDKLFVSRRYLSLQSDIWSEVWTEPRWLYMEPMAPLPEAEQTANQLNRMWRSADFTHSFYVPRGFYPALFYTTRTWYFIFISLHRLFAIRCWKDGRTWSISVKTGLCIILYILFCNDRQMSSSCESVCVGRILCLRICCLPCRFLFGHSADRHIRRSFTSFNR